MLLQPSALAHGLFESTSIGFIEHSMGAPKHHRTLLLSTRAEAMDVASDFHLLSQRQVLDRPDDGLDHSHLTDI
jgi:hypothetical protein